MFAGVVYTVKCIFKKHDIDLISDGDRRASLTIDLSNAKYLKED